jgi:hypothetical protein
VETTIFRRRRQFLKPGAIVLAALAFSLATASAQTPEATEGSQEKVVSPFLIRSLILPGWGQLAEKRYAEGVLFLAAEVFCLYEVLSFNHKGNTYYKKYQESETTPDTVRFRELTVKYDRKRNAYILAAAGVWALNLVDTYFIVKNKKNPKIVLNIQSGQDQKMALSVSCSF